MKRALTRLHALALAVVLGFAGCDDAQKAASRQDDDANLGEPSAGASTDEASRGHDIEFTDGEKPNRSFSLNELKEELPTYEITVDDPLYDKEKTFRAFSLKELAELGFGRSAEALADEEFVLGALDGYTVTIDGSRLIEEGGYAAYDDGGKEGWERIEDKADPSPLYMVWTGENQRDETKYPRAWQLTEFEFASEDLYAAARPAHLDEGARGRRGFELFRQNCIACHSVNQTGGDVGPELNIPKNITEYRSREFVLTYISDPEQFRYSKMPSFSHLTEDELESIWRYLSAMKSRKLDPANDERAATR